MSDEELLGLRDRVLDMLLNLDVELGKRNVRFWKQERGGWSK